MNYVIKARLCALDTNWAFATGSKCCKRNFDKHVFTFAIGSKCCKKIMTNKRLHLQLAISVAIFLTTNIATHVFSVVLILYYLSVSNIVLCLFLEY